MGLDLLYDDGQTPLDDDERDGLLIPTITTRSELDEFEQQNIEQAMFWVLKRKWKPEALLTEHFVKELHKQMYGRVWGWAGKFRTTNKNIGVDKWEISIALKQLLDDVTFWVAHQTYEPNEIAIRFKHRLVSIHCFPNGNGRHSRLMADVMIENIWHLPVFSWGASALLNGQLDIRKEYLIAIRKADAGQLRSLLDFAGM